MLKNGKKAFYINFNSFVESTEETNFNINSSVSQMPDKIRYFSKNYWTLKDGKVILENSSNSLFQIAFIDDNTIQLIANKDKVSEESIVNGLYSKSFSPSLWSEFITNIQPLDGEFFEDFQTVCLEPVNIAENENTNQSGLAYINKEYYYNFYSQNYENLASSQIFDVKVLPNAFALYDDLKVDVRTQKENFELSIGGLIPNNLVDSLVLANKVDNNVKEYFESFVRAYNNPNFGLIGQELKFLTEQFIISKEKNNLTKKAKNTFIPFPYYFYTEFSNVVSDSQDFIHVLNRFAVENDLLNFMINKQAFESKEFVYSADLSERREIRYFDLKDFINDRINTITAENTDDIRPLSEIVSYTNLIQYLNENIKVKQRNYKQLLNTPSYNEILFYKIEKRQFNYTSSPIQTFWIVPSEEEIIKFFDTQIKYGTEYFYTIYAYTLCVGSEYTYKPFEYANEIQRLSDINNGFYKMKIETKASYKIFEIPFAAFSNAIIEPPQTKPIVEIKLDNGNTRFMFEQSEINSLENPVVIENSDLKVFEDLKRFQDNENPNLIKFIKSTELNRRLQIYRTTERPTRHLSFQGKLYKTLNFNTNSFLDTLVKNIKYFYTFRYVNSHGIPSNVSKTFEVEIVDEDGYQELRVKELDLSGKAARKLTKDMKRYLLIRPSIIQTRPTFATNVSSIDEVEIGPDAEKVWNKDFILRIRSKKTNRVLEFNLSSIINKKK